MSLKPTVTSRKGKIKKQTGIWYFQFSNFFHSLVKTIFKSLDF